MDGTFRIMPKPGGRMDVRASQVLLITADYHGKVVLLFAILMTSRKVALYKKVFKFLKLNVPNFKPPQMMSDYERAMRNAFRTVYASSRLFGCR